MRTSYPDERLISDDTVDRVAYFRVSTGDQFIQSQRTELGGAFDREFEDICVSGGVMAAARPGFAKLLDVIRPNDVAVVSPVERLGRDAIDVHSTVKRLLDAGVTIDIRISPLVVEAADLILAVFAPLAQMERRKILERTEAGRVTARAALAARSLTHKGKASLERPMAHDGATVVSWRKANRVSIKVTADRFGISPSDAITRAAIERSRALALTIKRSLSTNAFAVRCSISLIGLIDFVICETVAKCPGAKKLRAAYSVRSRTLRSAFRASCKSASILSRRTASAAANAFERATLASDVATANLAACSSVTITTNFLSDTLRPPKAGAQSRLSGEGSRRA